MSQPLYLCTGCGKSFTGQDEIDRIVVEKIEGTDELIYCLECPDCGGPVKDKSVGCKL